MEKTNCCNVVGYYDEYLEKVMEIASLSSKDNSILVTFNIEDNKCLSKVELLEQNGDRGALKSVSFACTDSFYTTFLEKLVVKYAISGKVILTDIIDIDGDNQFTFRMVGEDNDLFSVDGISKDYALKLKSLVDNYVAEDGKQKVKVSDEAGMSDVFGLVILGALMFTTMLLLLLV